MEKGKKAAEAMEMSEKKKAYKITCGTFKARDEALHKAAEVKRTGINAALVIGKEGYTVLCIDGISKAEADTARKEIEAKGLKAVVSE